MYFKFPGISRITYSYKQSFSGLYFPIIEFQIYRGTDLVDLLGLIDSGASISVFKPDVASLLGIEIEKGEKKDLIGVGGRIKGYLHKLSLRIANKKITAPIIFSKEFEASFNLLGRQNVFDKFKITFEEKKKLISFE